MPTRLCIKRSSRNDRNPASAGEFEAEFEEPSLLTLGRCYETRGRFAGAGFHPVLKRVEAFLDDPLSEALAVRGKRAEKILALEDAVNKAVAALKERGLESPYLKTFVIARVNPVRFHKGKTAGFDDVIDKMLESARSFDAAKVKPTQLARASGPPEE